MFPYAPWRHVYILIREPRARLCSTTRLPWQWAVEKWYSLLSWQRAVDRRGQRWKGMWEQQSSIRIWARTRLHPHAGLLIYVYSYRRHRHNIRAVSQKQPEIVLRSFSRRFPPMIGDISTSLNLGYCIAGNFRQEFNFVAFIKAIFWLN